VSLESEAFSIIDIPAAPRTVLDSYDDLPVDAYMGHGTRHKRFSQYRLRAAADGDWTFERLPHRDYVAFQKFNPVAGGIKREYLPIAVDFTPFLRAGLAELNLDHSEDWQMNLHQNRSRAEAGTPAPLTPEGVHHDGHDFVMIAVLNRVNVGGGETRLWKPGADEPFWNGTLQPGQAVLLDDRAIAHDVTDVVSADGNPGHRDIFIAAFSRWSEKWYGEEHDAKALAADN
jgi:hypothetical protein